MATMSDGIAHISFRGGGLFVPVRTPYDRQMLVEQVVERAQTKGEVQVLVDNQRWMVQSRGGTLPECCPRCGSRCHSVCYSAAINHAAICVDCALGTAREDPPAATQSRLGGRRVAGT